MVSRMINYVDNGEDEIARISTFLYLSRKCSLHVDIMTALPMLDGLELIGDHVSRISTISIRPSVADTVTALHMQRWEQAAARILGRLSNSPSDVKDASCFGISLRENQDLYYCIVLMQFTTGNTANSSNMIDSSEIPVLGYPQTWEECITRCAYPSFETRH
jgi:hypothetical protein